MGVHRFVYICINMHVYIYTYIYEYICTYIYIYKCTQSTKFVGVHRLGKVCSVYIYIYICMYTWCVEVCWKCVEVCCSELQCVAMCRSVLLSNTQVSTAHCKIAFRITHGCMELQCVAVCRRPIHQCQLLITR